MNRKVKIITSIVLGILLLSLSVSQVYAAWDKTYASTNEYTSTADLWIPVTENGDLSGYEYCEDYGNANANSYLQDNPYDGAVKNVDAMDRFEQNMVGVQSCTARGAKLGGIAAMVRINTIYQSLVLNQAPVNIAYVISEYQITQRDFKLNEELWALEWRDHLSQYGSQQYTEEAKAYGGDYDNKGGFWEKVQDGLNPADVSSNVEVRVNIGDYYLIGPYVLNYDYGYYGDVHFSGISNMYLLADGERIDVTSIVKDDEVIDNIIYYKSKPDFYTHRESESGVPNFPKPGEEFYVKVPYDQLVDHQKVTLNVEFKYLQDAKAEIQAYQAYALYMVAKYDKEVYETTYHNHGHHDGCEQEVDEDTGRLFCEEPDDTEDIIVEVTKNGLDLQASPITAEDDYGQPLGKILKYERTEGEEELKGKDEVDITLDMGGEVWSDAHTGKEFEVNGILDGEDTMLQGVKVTIEGLYSGHSDSVITGSDGKYEFKQIPADQYNVIFEYNGIMFIAGQYDTNKLALNTSKAAESGRTEFNNKFHTISGTGAGHGEYGEAHNKSGSLTCTLDGSELNLIAFNDVTNKEAIFEATTLNAGAYYPQDKEIYINQQHKGTTRGIDITSVVAGVTYHSVYPYIEHVNLGLIERAKADFALRKDVYSSTITVNEKLIQYRYNSRYAEKEGIEQSVDLDSLNTTIKGLDVSRDEINARQNDIIYNRAIYKSDYNYRITDYIDHGVIEPDAGDRIDVNDNNTGEMLATMRAQYESTPKYDDLSTMLSIQDRELKVFVTYRITVSNESYLDAGTINTIVDYFDDTYRLVTQDEYGLIKDGNSEIATRTKIASKPFYMKNAPADTKVNPLTQEIDGTNVKEAVWEATAPWGATTDNGYNVMHTDSIGSEMLEPADKIDLYVTFEVEKAESVVETSDAGTSYELTQAVILGEKQNLAEIYSYSTFEHGSTGDPSSLDSLGKIDTDSSPGNLIPPSKDSIKNANNDFEDDEDNAPGINITLHSSGGVDDPGGDTGEERVMTGYVWRDEKTNTLETGQAVGNGVSGDANDKPVNGVTVQLVELVTLPVDPNNPNGEKRTYEYIWREMSTGETTYRYLDNHGDVQSSANGDDGVAENERKLQTFDSMEAGQYKFHSFVSGNFIVRFKYGDTAKTILANSSNPNALDGVTGANDISYNGQDYKSTAYQNYVGDANYDQNNPSTLNDEWYSFEDKINGNDVRISDAKDNETQRLKVIQYSSTIKNHIANVLSSHGATGTNLQNASVLGGQNINGTVTNNSSPDINQAAGETLDDLRRELINNTWMYADTAKINIEVEHYNNKAAIENDSYSASEVGEAVINEEKNKEYVISNIDFGLEERPKSDIKFRKDIAGLKVTLADGTVLIDTANGLSQNVQRPTPQIPYYQYYAENDGKAQIKNIITIFMDANLMQGATITIDYDMTVINDGEVDTVAANQKEFMDNIWSRSKEELPVMNNLTSVGQYLGETYYTGKNSNSTAIVTTNVDKIIDYVDDNLTFRKEDNNADGKNWDVVRTNTGAEQNLNDIQIKNQGTGTGKGDRYSTVNDDITIPNITTIQTRSLENTKLLPSNYRSIQEGQNEATVKLTLSKLISPENESDDLTYDNIAEIAQFSNTAGRRDYEAIPGNQVPTANPQEHDTDWTETVVILPPTGDAHIYNYVAMAIGAILVLGIGIVFIKKKVLTK